MAEPETAPFDPPTPPTPDRVVNVVHLEDSPLDAELVADRLEVDGLRCALTRVDTRDGFRAAITGTACDIILSDFALPEFDGLSALDIAREVRPEVPFVFVSGAIGEERAIESLRRGATDYVLKDRLERLAPAVRRALREADDRARLREAERVGRERFALLANASEILASTLDYDATLHNVAGLAMPLLADFGFFDVVEDDGEVRRIARAHDDPRTQRLLDATRWVRSDRTDVNLCALSTGRSALHPAIDDAWMRDVAQAPEHLALLRELAFCSMISVPLVARGRTTGALTLFYGASKRRHTPDDLALAEELARRAAVALENARLFRDAQRANRLKDEFLATVSHELRTPMTAILGWTSMLPQRVNDPEALRRGLAIIARNARAQARLIEDVLDVSRIVTGKLRIVLERVDVEGVVRAALDAVAHVAHTKSVEVRAAIDPEIGVTIGDPDRLQQVVWNLVNNAVKFTPPGGTVTVAAERIGATIEVRVADTGQGIRAEFLPHVFERFRQADSSSTRAHGGLGLGLAIARHIVELHGGTIRAESPGDGLGATFTVTLPVRAVYPDAAAPGAARDVTRVTPDAASLAGLRVLVCDDEEDARDLVVEVLRTRGAEVAAVGSVAAALERLDEFRPDVLVSDIGMPGEDGYALIRAIRARSHDRGGRTPAVALTAYTRGEDARRAFAAGFQLHVGKPIEPDALVAVVANLGGRSTGG